MNLRDPDVAAKAASLVLLFWIGFLMAMIMSYHFLGGC